MVSRGIHVQNLTLTAGNKNILQNFSLDVSPGQIHALMGKNGAGKSSLAKAISGSTDYTVTDGTITIDGQNILGETPDNIAQLGFFMAFQSPPEIPGVTVANFIRAAIQAKQPPNTPFNAIQYYNDLYSKMDFLNIDRSFSGRALNSGFSGGEKKRCEILQMLMLRPKYVILDEIDSGLDIDGIRLVARAIETMRDGNFAAIIISHHNKLLDYISPDFVHVLSNGKIIKTGGMEVVEELEKSGYQFAQQ